MGKSRKTRVFELNYQKHTNVINFVIFAYFLYVLYYVFYRNAEGVFLSQFSHYFTLFFRLILHCIVPICIYGNFGGLRLIMVVVVCETRGSGGNSFALAWDGRKNVVLKFWDQTSRSRLRKLTG